MQRWFVRQLPVSLAHYIAKVTAEADAHLINVLNKTFDSIYIDANGLESQSEVQKSAMRQLSDIAPEKIPSSRSA